MPQHLHRRTFIRATLASLLTLVVLAAPAAASAPAANPQAAGFEKTFLAETIDHHYMGVQMGRLCIAKSQSRRLGDICTAIVVNQQADSVRMRDDFLLGWHGIEKHPALMSADKRDLRELARRRGRAFDIALSHMFIEHHQTQLARSNDCLTKAEHHALKHICMDQIDTQSREIAQFRRVIRSPR